MKRWSYILLGIIFLIAATGILITAGIFNFSSSEKAPASNKKATTPVKSGPEVRQQAKDSIPVGKTIDFMGQNKVLSVNGNPTKFAYNTQILEPWPIQIQTAVSIAGDITVTGDTNTETGGGAFEGGMIFSSGDSQVAKDATRLIIVRINNNWRLIERSGTTNIYDYKFPDSTKTTASFDIRLNLDGKSGSITLNGKEQAFTFTKSVYENPTKPFISVSILSTKTTGTTVNKLTLTSI